MTGEQQIDYEALEHDARRGIVRTVLQRIAAMGRLPGEHHFYIAFDTRAPGVVVSKRLKQRYPEEMTIVLQHQFSNLTVDDDGFEVTLSFGNVPERLAVPLRAVRVFFDPSVPYGLQFDSSDLVGEAAREAGAGETGAAAADGRLSPALRPLEEPKETGVLAKARGPRKPRGARSDVIEEAAASAAEDGMAEQASAPMRLQAGRPKPVKSKPDHPANDSKVVQLDKFRKR